jgi:hypothetical protein
MYIGRNYKKINETDAYLFKIPRNLLISVPGIAAPSLGLKIEHIQTDRRL